MYVVVANEIVWRFELPVLSKMVDEIFLEAISIGNVCGAGTSEINASNTGELRYFIFGSLITRL